VTGYTVTSSPGGVVVKSVGVSTSVVVGGLTNGVSYTFTVTATNAAGDSVSSSPSNSVFVSGVPNSPSIVSVSASPNSAVVTFQPPSVIGGSAIVSYTAIVTPGSTSFTTFVGGESSNTIFVSGLTNGQEYTFTVYATNSFGNSAPSSASSPVTPASVPDRPTKVVATPGDSQASVDFTLPAFNGGSPITSYTVTATSGDVTVTASGASNPVTVTGLTNGVSYTFTVVATNAIGSSSSSTASAAVTPQALSATAPPSAIPYFHISTAPDTGASNTLTLSFTRLDQTDSSQQVTSYKVCLSDNTACQTFPVSSSTFPLSFAIPTATKNYCDTKKSFYCQRVQLQIQAINAVGGGPFVTSENVARPSCKTCTTKPDKFF